MYIKTYVFVVISDPDGDSEHVNASAVGPMFERVAKSVGAEYEARYLGATKRTFFTFCLPESDPRLAALRKGLDEAGVQWSTRREAVYSREDLEQAPLLVLGMDMPGRGNTGPAHGTEYDVSTGCPHCGTGAKQVTALRIRSSVLPRKIRAFPTGMGDVLVRDDLARILQESMTSTAGLRQVEDQQTHIALPWYQLLPTFTLPPLGPSTTGIKRGAPPPCTVCRRDGYFANVKEPFMPVYLRRDLPVRVDRLPDVCASWECFGKSSMGDTKNTGWHLARPMILISNRLLRVFLEHKVKGVGFTPVRFVD